jgi:uncharacterized protein with GYD domain
MPAYVTLWNWTEAGIKDFRETTARVERVKAEFEKFGATLDVRWTVGPYDGIGIIEAKDEESATAALRGWVLSGTFARPRCGRSTPMKWHVFSRRRVRSSGATVLPPQGSSDRDRTIARPSQQV